MRLVLSVEPAERLDPQPRVVQVLAAAVAAHQLPVPVMQPEPMDGTEPPVVARAVQADLHTFTTTHRRPQPPAVKVVTAVREPVSEGSIPRLEQVTVVPVVRRTQLAWGRSTRAVAETVETATSVATVVPVVVPQSRTVRRPLPQSVVLEVTVAPAPRVQQVVVVVSAATVVSGRSDTVGLLRMLSVAAAVSAVSAVPAATIPSKAVDREAVAVQRPTMDPEPRQVVRAVTARTAQETAAATEAAAAMRPDTGRAMPSVVQQVVAAMI